MSDQFSTPSTTGDEGVRTYRGRTIEELIPRIRAELGPDAIILREREGLTGGIGGFFAQRCVEIDAQAAPRVSIYDDDLDEEEYEDYDDDEYEDEETPVAPAPVAPAPVAREPVEHEPVERVQPVSVEPVSVPEPEPVSVPEPEPVSVPEPEPVAVEAPTRIAPFLDEASFAARLEEATFTTEQILASEPEPTPEPETPAPPPSYIPFDELEEPEAELPPEAEAIAEPEDIAEPEPEFEPEPEPSEQSTVAFEPPVDEPPSREPIAPAPWLAFAEEDAAVAPSPPTSEPVPPPRSGAPMPQFNRPAATPVPTLTPTPAVPEPEAPEAAAPEAAAFEPQADPTPLPAPVPAPISPRAPAPVPSAHYLARGVRRRAGILPAAERMLRAALDATVAANERRELEYQALLAARLANPAVFQSSPPVYPPAPSAQPPTLSGQEPAPPAYQPAPPAALPAPEAATPPPPAPAPATGIEADEQARARHQEHRRDAELERRLVACGLSPSRAAALVSVAISQRGPFSAGGELADEVRATIAAALPTPRRVPSEHGAVAIVGAGGSGKTRCVAALATTQARAGALVSVASLGAPGREDELGELLHGEAVNVIPAMRTKATARAVTSARERGLVIIDTAAVTPGDGSTIDVIAEALHSFSLDGTYLAVPATLSSQAGAKLVDGFSAFDLTGLVATHVDETDQLGVIVELSMLTGIPLSYTHTGLDLQNAVVPADPEQIAAQLLR